MLSKEEFIRQSLEHNLFFTRIIMEHCTLAIAFLSIKKSDLVQRAIHLRNQYEKLLVKTIHFSNRVMSQEAITSGEFVTPFTLNAELMTQFYTDIPINTSITYMQRRLMTGMYIRPALEASVDALNREAIALTSQALMLKTMLRNEVKEGKIFVFAYPSLFNHMIEETNFYLKVLYMLQNREETDSMRAAIEHQIIWNYIMEEHAMFIRQFLDPLEKELIVKAERFVKEFGLLTRRVKDALTTPGQLPQVTRESIKGTSEIRDFKAQATLGILEHKIKSIIPPLLADHVLREANYYLNMLRMFERKF